jgi:hypothetical protein
MRRLWVLSSLALVTAFGGARAQSPPVASAVPGDSALPPDLLLLARIKVRVAQILDRQPNYTCVQTVERSRQKSASRKFELVDVLRLEVALVDGKEMFAWPGSRQFQETELRNLVTSGTIGNGNFALHARAVFLTHAPTYTYRGEEMLNGRRAHRFDYEVKRLTSGYSIRVNSVSGIAGFRGSFWADAETLDLLRLDVIAQEIPPELPIRASRDTMIYQRARIGSAEFVLPASSELVMEDLDGTISRNQIRFSDCRQYSGESVLSFDDPPPDEAPRPPKRILTLPAGLRFDLELLDPLDSAKAIIGTPVRARLRGDLKRKGELLLPKGTRVEGRIAGVDQEGDYVAIELLFERFDAGYLEAPFHALTDAPNPVQPLSPGYIRVPVFERKPNRAVIHAPGKRLQIGAGYQMVWRTQDPPSAR